MGYVHDEHIEKPIRITRLLHSSINADNYWPCISFDIKMNILPGFYNICRNTSPWSTQDSPNILREVGKAGMGPKKVSGTASELQNTEEDKEEEEEEEEEPELSSISTPWMASIPSA
ncbi:uncharacterized protein LOC117610845 isoform X1 [Osmia lignaria lignaria]|uniref:uncharacterized protein LOC117610845 isoform X1 n=1 Tax=Osmia lignaria lignaria TaxID=1437193 RepID=UPI00147965E0|nr:uncharacterized protein LOC117610845 isoform X1 [Osmia lignaria]